MTENVPVRVRPRSDRDSSEWWGFVRDHRLHWQRCVVCRTCRWPSRGICSNCQALEWEWERAGELATVASWITNHKPAGSGLIAHEHTVIVRPVLAERDGQRGFFLPGLWDAETPPTIGMLVRLRYDDFVAADGTAFTLLGWRPEDQSPNPDQQDT